MGDGRHFGKVLNQHHGICSLPERHQGSFDFALTWAADLMMMVFDRYTDGEQALGDFTAQVVKLIIRGDGVISPVHRDGVAQVLVAASPACLG